MELFYRHVSTNLVHHSGLALTMLTLTLKASFYSSSSSRALPTLLPTTKTILQRKNSHPRTELLSA
jgi:hypothetical protein